MTIISAKRNIAKHIRYKFASPLVPTCQDIKSAISMDEILYYILQSEGCHIQGGSTPNLDYNTVLKQIVAEENQYLRQMYLITKVFRDFILMKGHMKKHGKSRDIDIDMNAIFSNINSIIALTLQVIQTMEDALDAKESDSVPVVSHFFTDIAETMMFDDYIKFAEDILSDNFKIEFKNVLSRSDVSNDVKYYLPMLLQEPIYHCFHYHKYITSLMNATTLLDEKSSFKQVLSMLNGPMYNVTTIMMEMPGYFGSIRKTPTDMCHSTFQRGWQMEQHGDQQLKMSKLGKQVCPISDLPPHVTFDQLSCNIYEGPLLVA